MRVGSLACSLEESVQTALSLIKCSVGRSTYPVWRFVTSTPMLLGEQSREHLRRSTHAVAEALPDATVVDLPGQGHAALQTAPDLVADVLLRHL